VTNALSIYLPSIFGNFVELAFSFKKISVGCVSSDTKHTEFSVYGKNISPLLSVNRKS
jgi:hypothetical protein